MARIVVVALGGNAITRSGQVGTHPEQAANVEPMAELIWQLRAAGWTVVVVHGNGPQVGNLAVQQEEGASRVPEMPLFVLGAMTEGQLGSLLALALRRTAPSDRAGGAPGVVAMVTHMVVDEQDPGFTRPTKPIGPFLTESEARRHAAEQGWVVGEDAGRGFRRLVASPRPQRIVELAEIRALLERDTVVVAAGGGGVPVVLDGHGLRGVDAVIDKDLAAQRLATELAADALIMITDVPQVLINFGTPSAESISEMTADQAQRHYEASQFPEGSMGPKVRAAIDFVRRGGATAVITNAERALASLEPQAGAEAGTRIVPQAEAINTEKNMGAAS
ncbi:MAG TPA: carbamate kinase [Pseudonocardia sp.]|jgi:carbamate kinase